MLRVGRVASRISSFCVISISLLAGIMIPGRLHFWRRRCGFRSFLLTLCGVYFTAMYVFQSGLETRVRTVDDERVALKWVQVGADAFDDSMPKVDHAANPSPQKTWRKRADFNAEREFENIRRQLGHREQELQGLAVDVVLMNAVNKRAAHNEKNISSAAAADAEVIADHISYGDDDDAKFVLIGGDVYIFSAYWDERPNDFDNLKNGSYVRMMAVVRGRSRPRLACRWPPARERKRGNVFSEISYYEMCENHGRPYGSFILSCVVPDHVTAAVRDVAIVAADVSSVSVRVMPLKPSSDVTATNKLTVCVPPLFGAVSSSRIIEFLELTFLLGADRIVMYDFNVPMYTRRILNYYANVRCGNSSSSSSNRNNRSQQRRCRLNVIPWRLPESVNAGIWYQGQSIAIQDCMYRHMAVSQFVMFNDIDEFVVAHGNGMSDWNDISDQLWERGRCALQFVSAFYDPSPSSDDQQDSSSNQIDLMTMRALKRSTEFSSIRTKCCVKPYEIFEAGIHHISKPIWADLEVHKVDRNVAYLHHYRSCVGNLGMSCFGSIEDDTMLRYREKLNKSVNDSLTRLTSSL